MYSIIWLTNVFCVFFLQDTVLRQLMNYWMFQEW